MVDVSLNQSSTGIISMGLHGHVDIEQIANAICQIRGIKTPIYNPVCSGDWKGLIVDSGEYRKEGEKSITPYFNLWCRYSGTSEDRVTIIEISGWNAQTDGLETGLREELEKLNT